MSASTVRSPFSPTSLSWWSAERQAPARTRWRAFSRTARASHVLKSGGFEVPKGCLPRLFSDIVDTAWCGLRSFHGVRASMNSWKEGGVREGKALRQLLDVGSPPCARGGVRWSPPFGHRGGRCVRVDGNAVPKRFRESFACLMSAPMFDALISQGRMSLGTRSLICTDVASCP